jgi:hypothetical protein
LITKKVRFKGVLTVTGGDEKVVGEGSQGTDHGCMEEFKLLVFIMEVSFEKLINSEVGSMGGDAATRDDLGTFPETKETLFLI